MTPQELRYATTHEWVHVGLDERGEKIATVGISAFAIEALTDLVFMDLAKVGTQVTAGESFGEIESVKAVSDLYSPVDGEIVAVNEALIKKLETLKDDPYGQGWLIKVRLKDESALDDLLDYDAYQKQCAEEGH
ncbi:MAG: glycine cleavage system protein GcvH [Pirellulales bacterium]|nr:glycine cleavage system protein GcvH [Pirellulales bacterium]